VKADKTILLVEDDEGDRRMVERALAHHGIQNPLRVVAGAEEALRELQGGKRPDIVLLDIAQPATDAVRLLEIIKDTPQLKNLPVVVLTGSPEEQERMKTFELGVAGYILKPDEFEDYARVIQTIVLYWTLSETP
jgi:CheY-like chemotaxis protein